MVLKKSMIKVRKLVRTVILNPSYMPHFKITCGIKITIIIINNNNDDAKTLTPRFSEAVPRLPCVLNASHVIIIYSMGCKALD